jgi:hypothetical protein
VFRLLSERRDNVKNPKLQQRLRRSDPDVLAADDSCEPLAAEWVCLPPDEYDPELDCGAAGVGAGGVGGTPP